ncbi:MAG: GNAT family N-acetyltransferase [Pseudomonadota bacterium]
MYQPATVFGHLDIKDRQLGASFTVQVTSDLSQVETAWREFETRAICTPYQSFDFVRLWIETIGVADRVSPVIAVIRSRSGQITAILPFGRYKRGPVTVAGWLGDQNMNYFMGLFDPDAALTGQDLKKCLVEIAKAASVDGFFLKNQPRSWLGFENPALSLETQASPSNAFGAILNPDFDTHFANLGASKWKRQLRSKLKKLNGLGAVVMRKARDKADAHQIMDVYIAQKSKSLSAQGISSPFDLPDVRNFFHSLIDISTDDLSLLDLYVLELNGEPIAVYGGTPAFGHFAASICSYAEGPHAAASPGEQLLRFVVEDRCKIGDTCMDLGTGEGRYKKNWCPERIDLFDAVIPVTLIGRLYALLAHGKRKIMRTIKGNETLWSRYRSIRRSLYQAS